MLFLIGAEACRSRDALFARAPEGFIFLIDKGDYRRYRPSIFISLSFLWLRINRDLIDSWESVQRARWLVGASCR